MYCNHCGREIPEDTRSCTQCGRPAAAAASSQNAGAGGWTGPAADSTPPNGSDSRYRSGGSRTSETPNRNWIAAVAYIPYLFWIPLIADGKSRFRKQAANQGLLLSIIAFILNLLGRIFGGRSFFSGIPFIGLVTDIVNGFFSGVIGLLTLGLLAFCIIGFVRALSDHLFKVPFLGDIHILDK